MNERNTAALLTQLNLNSFGLSDFRLEKEQKVHILPDGILKTQ